MRNVRLFTPGPTVVPDKVRQAQSLSLIHHRSDEFGQILQECRKRLSWLTETEGPSVILTCSGTGGMEACVSAFFSSNEEVVIVEAGKFGQRWKELARHFQLKERVVDVPWGRAVTVEQVMSALTASTKGVLIQACESSTGVLHPIAELGKALASSRADILFVVDAISSIGVDDLSMTRDHIDVLVGASQKGLMSPPGLATVTIHPRAVDRMLSKHRSFYFSLQHELAKQHLSANTLFTPAISLVQALNVALQLIEEEGKCNVFARHQKMQRMARRALCEMGLDLFNVEAEASCGLTVAVVPQGLNCKTWLQELRHNFGLWIAGGQAELAGKIFRLGHMGACQPKDLSWAIQRIEESLSPLLLRANRGDGSIKVGDKWQRS